MRPRSKTTKEHIFQATLVTELTIKWKELVEQGRTVEASDVLSKIIELSAQMFLRMAQYEGFHHSVDLQALLSIAQVKTPKWLESWEQSKGRLFSWLSKCARNAFLSEVCKAGQHSKRFYATGDNLEKFVGSEDHSVVKHEAANQVRDEINNITCRWCDQQIRTCARFHIECLVENPDYDRKKTIYSGAYVSGLSYDTSKFLYHWALIALRDAMIKKLSMSYTEQDLFVLSNAYTYLPDMLNIITWKQMLNIIALFGGLRIKIPTLVHLDRLKRDHNISEDITNLGGSPDDIQRVSKKYNVSQKSAQDIYENMAGMLGTNNSGEYSVFEDYN